MSGQTEKAEHAFGMEDVGVLWGVSDKHGSHHGEESAAGGVQRDRFVRHAESAAFDAGTQVATGVGTQRGEQEVVV